MRLHARELLSIFLASATILLASTTTFATTMPAQGNAIRGKIRNSSGQNMPHVIVQLETGNGQPIDTTVTNNEGDFEFRGLSETSYILTVDVPDYNKLTEHVDFVRNVSPDAPGEHRTVELLLVPKTGQPIPANRIVSGQDIPKAARESLDRAAQLTKDNKTQEAIKAMQDAVAAYPEYFEAHLMLANELMKQDRLDDAISELELARRINPKDDRVYQSFGRVLMKQKKYALASQVFAEAVRLNPTDSSLLLLKGSALIEHAVATNPAASAEAAAERQNALAMAERDLLKTIDFGGRSAGPAHLQLARLYEKRGERARAADQLEAYLKSDPEAKNAASIRAAIMTLRSPAPDSKKP